MINRVTPPQAATAVSIVLALADVATEGGKAAELRLGRPIINQIVDLAEEIKRNG